jgi:alkanesulfonate monooxygenase SsuD/methylene tetrahydromethanopterin reductase-like flavin-dependent oxidoreductase (luciferase family)
MRLGMYVDLRNPPSTGRSWPDQYAVWLDRIQHCEELGAEAVWLSEHHFFDDGYLPQLWTFAAAVAARTTRVRIGTAVNLLPLHPSVELAEQIAVVDILSAGRAEPGFGVGYRRPEYLAFGGDFRHRYSVFAERIGELRQLWGEVPGPLRPVTPPPVQRPMPVWGGFGGPQGARLAGRLGLGLQSLSPDLFREYAAALAEAGHPPEAARVSGSFEFFLTDDPDRLRDEVVGHARYRWDSYNKHIYEGTRLEATPPREGEPGAIGGHIEVGTPEQVAETILRGTRGLPVSDVFGWSDFPGMPEPLIDEHLRLCFTRLAPLLRDA